MRRYFYISTIYCVDRYQIYGGRHNFRDVLRPHKNVDMPYVSSEDITINLRVQIANIYRLNSKTDESSHHIGDHDIILI